METRSTLLDRIKDRGDNVAWNEFNQVYFPLLSRYAKIRGLSSPDAEDIAQTCLTEITRQIREFEYDQTKGSFRNWLRRIVERRVIDFLRKQGRQKTVPLDADRGATSADPWHRLWIEEHLRVCLDSLRKELEPRQYDVFVQYAIEQRPAERVADDMGIPVNQVYLAKSRSLARLREMMRERFGNESAMF